ncbi:MAG: putative selenium-dependent hydroxylase accessory protein YqeC [Dehalococcoidia bacterium]|nr:putative selenium-dependent hydroxylase accessory protein YqeC [Dehalococcoidia bacterium]
MKLKEALNVGQSEVISAVGAGGKTTLMFSLARELASEGRTVVTTTTSRIHESEPALHGSPSLVLEERKEGFIKLLQQTFEKDKQVTVVSKKLPSLEKLQGIAPELVDKLANLGQISCIIVEADGAAHRSLKAPNSTEPVIPQSTTLVISIVGIDALGCHLNEEKVFRPHIVSRLIGLELGEIITADAIATLITHPEGITRGSPPGARIIPFINEMDLEDDLSQGRRLSLKILERKHPQIERVILGQAQASEPVVEIVSMPAQ